MANEKAEKEEKERKRNATPTGNLLGEWYTKVVDMLPVRHWEEGTFVMAHKGSDFCESVKILSE